MKGILVSLFFIMLMGMACDAEAKPSFEELIKKDKFYVKMSRSDLAEDHHASTLVLSCVDFRFQDEEKV